MTVPKSIETCTRYAYMQAKNSDDGMRNNEQHEGKGRGWAYNNHNMHNPTIKDVGSGYTCCMHAHPLPLPSRCISCFNIASENLMCAFKADSMIC